MKNHQNHRPNPITISPCKSPEEWPWPTMAAAVKCDVGPTHHRPTHHYFTRYYGFTSGQEVNPNHRTWKEHNLPINSSNILNAWFSHEHHSFFAWRTTSWMPSNGDIPYAEPYSQASLATGRCVWCGQMARTATALTQQPSSLQNSKKMWRLIEQELTWVSFFLCSF